MSSDPEGEAARHRRPKHRRKLSPRGRRATKQAAALSTKLHAGLSAEHASGRVHIAPAAKQMRTSLAKLRHDLARSRDPKAKAAAQGLAELQVSVAKLAQASAHANPAKASELLHSGLEALERAQRHARKAGHAWPL